MISTNEQIEQAAQRALRDFEKLIISGRPSGYVLNAIVQSLDEGLRGVGDVGSMGSLAWLPADRAAERYMVVAKHGRGAALAIDKEAKAPAGVDRAIRMAVERGEPVIVGPDQAEFRGTDLQGTRQYYVPMDAGGEVAGVVQVICAGDLPPSIDQQCVVFIQQGARAAGMALARRRSRSLEQSEATYRKMLQITRRLLNVETAGELVHELANQARPLFEAQRVAVVGYRGRRAEVAFSDVVDTNRKAVLVRSVEMLADAVCERRMPMTFIRGQQLEKEDEALAPLLDEVYALGGARAICLTPIRLGERIGGVVMGEYDDPEAASRQAATQHELAQQVGPILGHVIHRQRRPLRRTSDALARMRDRPRSFLSRSAVAAAVVAGLIYLLFFMPVAIPVYGNARLAPAKLAVMAAPRAGQVEEVLVDAGQAISSGQAVATMDRTDLRMERAEVDKAIEAQRVKLDSARAQGGRTAQADIAAAGLEIERLRIRRASVERKIERATVRSLIDGVVLTERPDRMEGRTIREGEAIVEAADLSHFELIVELREEDLALVERRLRSDQPVAAAFLSRAWPDRMQRVVVSDVTAVSPTSSPDQRSKQHVFRITTPIDLEGMSPQLILANPSGRAKLQAGTGSLAYRYGRRVWRFIQMTLLF